MRLLYVVSTGSPRLKSTNKAKKVGEGDNKNNIPLVLCCISSKHEQFLNDHFWLLCSGKFTTFSGKKILQTNKELDVTLSQHSDANKETHKVLQRGKRSGRF